MAEPSQVPRFNRGCLVVASALGMVVMGNSALKLHHGRQLLMESGAEPVIDTGLLAFLDASFLFFIGFFVWSLRTAIREWPTAPSIDFSPPNLRVQLGEAFREPSKDIGPAYRWGMLALIVLLLAWDTEWWLERSAGRSADRYGNLLVCLLLLLNHLAWGFRFPPTVSFALRVLATGWLLLAGSYLYFFP